MRRAPEAACWLRLGFWSGNSAHSHPGSCAFNLRVLRSCLVPQSSYPPYRPCHQRRFANCDWMPASYNSGQTSHFRGIQPAERRRIAAPLSLARRAMEPGHLLHSMFTSTSSANARRLKSKHPFVPTAQQLISSSDNNNIRAAHWADHQWNANWAINPTQTPHFHHRHRHPPPGATLPRRARV